MFLLFSISLIPCALSGVIVGDVPILRGGGSCRRGGGGRRGCRRRRRRRRCRTTRILVSAPILSYDTDTNARWLSSGHAGIHLRTVRRISTGAIYGVSFSRFQISFSLRHAGNIVEAPSLSTLKFRTSDFRVIDDLGLIRIDQLDYTLNSKLLRKCLITDGS